ncbi:MAG: aspartate kinase [Fimbriimonadaceae bacterium]|nr:aspartate kinase [Fimbriimonadaceae bacterium]QYK57028.1 MAG: aspartate kinase [Fimbriimonadaceae bacterium]
MKIVVMKFGGTSVKTREARSAAALRVLSAREQGFHPVVVVSAIGRRGEPYATDTLVQLLRDVDATVEPEPREMDLLMSCGEILSSVVFSHTLTALGQPAISLRGGQAGIRTDGVYGNARILGVNPIGIHEALRRGLTPVVCGFQGVWTQGGLPGAELTTLGRGGSDTTAAALGAGLRADRVEIFTDVDGVKTADPDFVPEAPTLRKVTYDEVAEIAHLGAKVLHPRAAEIAMRFAIPLWVKNTFSEDEGTEIVPRERFPGRRVTGVTHSGKLVHVQTSLSDLVPEHRRLFAEKLYDILARHMINLFMIDLSPGSIGFAVPREQFADFRSVCDGLVIPLVDKETAIYVLQVGTNPSHGVQSQMELLRGFGRQTTVRMHIEEGCTMVSLVGHDYMQQPGVFLRVLTTLQGEQIPVLQTSDSDFSISCLIPESELRKAVTTLHDSFGLKEAR